jgi:hypothetical protein
MANEREGATSGGEGRRRYFRRRQHAAKIQEKNNGSKEAPVARKRSADKSDQVERAQRSQPPARRRRRSRGRSIAAPNPKIELVPENILDLGDYAPPTSVFIYTHVSRPGGRDSYEFRSEHFSKVGRHLEDYEIDLSLLYPDQNGEASTDDVMRNA